MMLSQQLYLSWSTICCAERRRSVRRILIYLLWGLPVSCDHYEKLEQITPILGQPSVANRPGKSYTLPVSCAASNEDNAETITTMKVQPNSINKLKKLDSILTVVCVIAQAGNTVITGSGLIVDGGNSLPATAKVVSCLHLVKVSN